ncbi:hypothetical protein Y032_0042g577 [Ancylostoma ceylanicum]|uniref:Uncharacterized protein n=1 Tax=Ancylostoma ceylanicum TaxID=53326 RepID=A0A016UG30_9BILA|nr:hypothetical protein Y032_0042g577 [Ancylostoma ceylanicum]
MGTLRRLGTQQINQFMFMTLGVFRVVVEMPPDMERVSRSEEQGSRGIDLQSQFRFSHPSSGPFSSNQLSHGFSKVI